MRDRKKLVNVRIAIVILMKYGGEGGGGMQGIFSPLKNVLELSNNIFH